MTAGFSSYVRWCRKCNTWARTSCKWGLYCDECRQKMLDEQIRAITRRKTDKYINQ